MKKATCNVKDCDAPLGRGGARGMCGKHYHRWQRYGDPQVVLPRGWRGTAEERFWKKVNKDGPVSEHRPDLGPCWIWRPSRHLGEYGVFAGKPNPGGASMKMITTGAYRFSYELAVGPIPDGHDLDHLCRVPACVNPLHLDPVTHRENLIRGVGPSATNATKSTCPAGHAYDHVDARGTRRCTTCRKAAQKRLYEARKQKRVPEVPCACGCGGLIPSVDAAGRPRSFKNGHRNRLTA